MCSFEVLTFKALLTYIVSPYLLQELQRQKEMLLAAEMERERRRQHMNLIRQLEIRRKFEEREKKKHQMVLDRLIMREKRLASRKRDAEILAQIR